MKNWINRACNYVVQATRQREQRAHRSRHGFQKGYLQNMGRIHDKGDSHNWGCQIGSSPSSSSSSLSHFSFFCVPPLPYCAITSQLFIRSRVIITITIVVCPICYQLASNWCSSRRWAKLISFLCFQSSQNDEQYFRQFISGFVGIWEEQIELDFDRAPYWNQIKSNDGPALQVRNLFSWYRFKWWFWCLFSVFRKNCCRRLKSSW